METKANFTHFYEHYRMQKQASLPVAAEEESNISYVGFHLTLFDQASNCHLGDVGDKARVMWVWETVR